MFGVDIASLNVYVDEFTNMNDPDFASRTLVWTKSRSQGNKWLLGRTHVKTQHYWQITLEAVRGKSSRGDIAIGI